MFSCHQIDIGVIFWSGCIDADWLAKSGPAAWLQAISVIVAVAIAIIVPWRIHAREAKERARDRRRQAQGIALLIGDSLRKLDEHIDLAIDNFRPDHTGPLEIEVPQLIMEQVNQLWIIGPAGDHILHLISTLEGNIRLKAGLDSLIAGGNIEKIGPALDVAKERMRSARDDVRNARMEINRFLEKQT